MTALRALRLTVDRVLSDEPDVVDVTTERVAIGRLAQAE